MLIFLQAANCFISLFLVQFHSFFACSYLFCGQNSSDTPVRCCPFSIYAAEWSLHLDGVATIIKITGVAILFIFNINGFQYAPGSLIAPA